MGERWTMWAQSYVTNTQLQAAAYRRLEKCEKVIDGVKSGRLGAMRGQNCGGDRKS